MSKHCSLIYAITAFVKETDGIGESKHQAKLEHGGVSPKIHSFGAKTRYLGVINEFNEKMFQQKITRVKRVRPEHLLEFLEEKAPDLTEKTMRTNMAALKKYFQTSAWKGREDILEVLSKNYYYILDLALPSGEAKPFSNPEAIIEKIKEPPHKATATIQLHTGARIDDVPKVTESIRRWKEGQRLLIDIHKSKGGRGRSLDFTDRMESFEKIREAVAILLPFIKQKGWQTIKEEYYPNLRRAAAVLGESYTGSHAFRVNYAQRRHQELIKKGLSEKEAFKIVTQELGHNRISMAKAYVYR
jgi:uncharacterized protein YoaH (UPF0181 family)